LQEPTIRPARRERLLRRRAREGLVALGLVESADATFGPPWKVNCTGAPNACKQAYFWRRSKR
jgi:hypothetical protein